jgi:hypothetical protein
MLGDATQAGLFSGAKELLQRRAHPWRKLAFSGAVRW